MFRRTTKTDPDPAASAAADPEVVRPGGKGRPTPTRKEAEAAARARAKPARTRKEQAARDRADRYSKQQKVREAMKSGDDTFMPVRDKGPVRRLVRDMVDSRFSFTELILPLMVVSLVLQYSGSPNLAGTGSLILMMTLLLVILDMTFLRFRMRREVRRRFPDETLKGLTFYAITRSMQIKPMRLPKPQVRIGSKLPETYR